MLIQLLLLSSCQGLSSPSDKSVDAPRPMDARPRTVAESQVRLPSGAATVRECYAGSTVERRPTASATTPAPMPSPKRPSPAKATSPSGNRGRTVESGSSSTAYEMAQGAPAEKAKSAPAADEGSRMSDAAAASASPPPMAAAEPVSQPSLGATGTGFGGGGASEADKGYAMPTTASPGASKPMAEQARKENKKSDSPMATSKAARGKDMEAKSEEYARPMDVRPQENLDWGAHIYLSNDDSMSLASAQRLLWAVQNRGPVKQSEIRPHEFLNYFSFDTAEVREGDLFSVQAAAEQTGNETLTMAFAMKGGAPPRQPLDVTLVLDRSGSMAAEGRMEYLKRGLHKMEGQLKYGDRVDLVLFDSSVCTPLEDYVVGRDDPSLLTDAIERIQPRSSTNLDAGLTEGYRIAAARPDNQGRNQRVLLITDALLNEGRIDPNIVSEVGKRYEEAHIRLSAVGVGREFNDKVLDQLTEKGKGAYAYLGSEAVVDRIFGPMFDSLTRTVAHDVHFAVQLPPSLAMTRFYGEEASTVKEDVQPIHYFANTSQLFLQDVRVKDGRLVPNDPVSLTVEWSDVDTGAPHTQVFTSTVGELVGGDPRNLRKGRALMAWTDMISARAMGSDPCGAPFTTWKDRVDTLGEDAEISWLDGLTSPLCGQSPRQYVSSTAGVPYKVKVDSDQVIAEVQLTCSGRTLTDALSGSDTVARFDSATPGSGCQLTLVGNVPMSARVDVPATGGETRCTVRGGRLSCG